MKKCIEMIENTTPKDYIEYINIICKTEERRQENAREDIGKHNLDEIREIIEASNSLKNVRKTHCLGKNRAIKFLAKQDKEFQGQDRIKARI